MIQGLNDEKQKTYRSAVGTLLYLVKHSRPDIANAVRELSKVMDSGTEGNWKQLLRTVNFVKNTREKGLKLQPHLANDTLWEVRAFVDSDWAGDQHDRRSVSGWAIYIAGWSCGMGFEGAEDCGAQLDHSGVYWCYRSLQGGVIHKEYCAEYGPEIQIAYCDFM